MAGGAVLGAALQGSGPADWGIYVDNLDVRRFVPIDSLEVTEAGPGDVSSMRFVIEDPEGVIPIPAEGAYIVQRDFVLDCIVFAGYLGDYTVEVMGIGRTMSINAVGLEILLDWTVLPPMQLPGSDATPVNLTHNISELATTIANAVDPRVNLYAPDPGPGVPNPVNGDTTWPIGTLKTGDRPENFSAGREQIAATLRQDIEIAIGNSGIGLFLLSEPVDAVVTVDFYRRLRVFYRASKPDDYTDLTIVDTVAGPLVASSIKYEVHPSDVVRAVYVVGTGFEGWVDDGTGIFGRRATISSSTATSAARITQIGETYLASQASLVRGTLVLEDWAPPNCTVHPASNITITDAQVSLAAQTYAIAEITKTFHGSGRQTWEIAFGGRRPSFIEAVRRDYGTDAEFRTIIRSGTRGN